jgi:hypothetical protein
MKLPKSHDLYNINKQLDNLAIIAASLNYEHMQDSIIQQICEDNLINLRKVNAIIIHLELAIEEVLKVPGVQHE